MDAAIAAARAAVCLIFVAALACSNARAAPWTEVGDSQLRSDVDVLAASGIVDAVTTQWPLPWGGLLARLNQDVDIESAPDYVRSAAERVDVEGQDAIATNRVSYALISDLTNLPDVVRGFDALGRENMQEAISGEWLGDCTAIRLQVGAQTLDRYDRQTLMLDGSYIAQRVGDIVLYAGYMDHWWGPGWDTALSLSNNARPFPQIGYRRLTTAPIGWPILSWLGPWNHEMFLGLLDGPRRNRNILLHAMRWAFNPFSGFEFALAHLQELCGTGEVCKPLAELFNYRNGARHVSSSKDETDFDFHYANVFRGFTYEIYNQEMDRDTGPFVHSLTSHLFGASLWVPVRSTAIRFTAEFADTISTFEFFSFGHDDYGVTYADYKYVDGWEYRGRTLGSSLDTDSRLASFHASWAAPLGWTYTLTYYRAFVGSLQTEAAYQHFVGPIPPLSGNRVSSAPVTIDIGEARLRFPFRRWSIDLALRVQDDRPRPDRGFAAAGEFALTYRL